MTNLFSALQLPARPWLDPDEVKEAYVRQSERAYHRTDADGDAERATLNQAFRVLREPSTRLEHLLALTKKESLAPRQVSAEVSRLFGQTANQLQVADRFLTQLSGKTSVLLRAIHLQEAPGLRADLDSLASTLGASENAHLNELKRLDEVWQEDPGLAREPLAQLAFELTFLEKWQGQLRERLLRLDEAAT
ncbi:MAG TPA: hypothetical protein VGD78_11500 [Chthoniobacterales bacterium]